MRKTRTLILLTAAAMLLGMAPTNAAPTDTQVVSGPTAKYYGYLTPVVVISKGGTITYTNVDIERHNVVQDVNADGVHGSAKRKWCGLFTRGRCPLFYSALIGLGQSEAVQGLQYVQPGQIYTFYCTLHPGMKGKLVISPAAVTPSP